VIDEMPKEPQISNSPRETAVAWLPRVSHEVTVQGQAVVLGFPFPVPQASRFQPRLPA
jgi:hypothetical protein